MVRKAALIALLLVASPALGQQTNCHWISGGWSCESQGRTELDPSIISKAYDTPQIDIAGLMKKRALLQQRNLEIAHLQRVEKQAVDAQARKVQVSEMLSTGNCIGAQGLALGAGDIELANQVKTYCASPPKVPSPKP